MKQVLDYFHHIRNVLWRWQAAPVSGRATCVQSSRKVLAAGAANVPSLLQDFELLPEIANVANFLDKDHIYYRPRAHYCQTSTVSRQCGVQLLKDRTQFRRKGILPWWHSAK